MKPGNWEIIPKADVRVKNGLAVGLSFKSCSSDPIDFFHDVSNYVFVINANTSSHCPMALVTSFRASSDGGDQ